jgi:hypothetical protein
MNKKITSLFLVLFALVCSCQKCPTNDQLQGTWNEVTSAADKSKLVFQGDRLYFFHIQIIDTFSYTFDTKHCTLGLTLLHNSVAVSSKGCDVQYHKSKKIMNVWNLFPPIAGTGNQSVNNYKQ